MRISIEDDDPGYMCVTETHNFAVFFNGERQECVLTADEEKGYLRAAILRDGKLSVVGDTIEARDYFGVVRIESLLL